ncbi:MAG TPA: hypothetical protein PLW97_02945 [Synergistaceae bacterium]|nr:hypothetical protein [Synergistaceae bacterium]HPQ36578.1 hypothetical protein [Synergistaceae bacterium]
MPPANRIEAQRHLFQAYDMYAKNRFPEALTYLDRAIEENTYLIDYYLLRALVLRRIGDFSEAQKEIRHYLEVRPGDPIPRRIGKNLERLDRFGENALRGTLPRENYAVEKLPLKSLLGLSPLLRKNMAGVGKVAVFGDFLCVPDTLGDQLYVVDLTNPYNGKAFVTPAPVSVLDFKNGEILLVSQKGELRRINIETREESLEGTLEKVFLKDAAFLSDSLLVCADWGGRRLVCVSYPDLVPLWEWAPSEDITEFAPRGIDVCGNLLALADGGGNIFLLDALEGTLLEEYHFPDPLEVGWTSWGSLGVLDERGEVFLQDPSGEFRSFITLSGAWSFARHGMNLVFIHVSGEILWFASMRLPDNFDVSLFWLQFPEFRAPAGGGIARFQAGLSYPVRHLFPRDSSLFDNSYAAAIWMEAGLEGRVDGSVSKKRYSLAAGEKALPEWEGLSLGVVPGAFFEGLARITQKEKGLPGKIILHPETQLSFEEQKRLFGYALFNDIPVSLLWSSVPPPASLTRICRLTGGDERTLLSQEPAVRESYFYTLTFPLPPDIYPSGYPSKSFLSLFLESGYYSFLDWMPFWPAGLDASSLEAIPQN